MATPMATPGLGAQGGGGGMLGVQRLPPEVNRILYVRNLPFNMSPEDLYKIFGDYGAIRQIRMYALVEHALFIDDEAPLEYDPPRVQRMREEDQGHCLCCL